MIPPPPRSPLFPSTPLFRSRPRRALHPALQHGSASDVLSRGRLLSGDRALLGAPQPRRSRRSTVAIAAAAERPVERGLQRDRKSTRLNSSHVRISYAVFCLK